MATQADLDQLRAECDDYDAALLALVHEVVPDELSSHSWAYVRSYVLLCHAGIEHFIEQCFSDYVRACLNPDATGRVDPSVYIAGIRLGDKIRGNHGGKGQNLDPVHISAELPGRVISHFITPNNGIKKKDLKRIVQGIGLNWLQFEATCSDLIAAAETLGAKRGSVAHVRSAAGGLQAQIYPADARGYVAPVLVELPALLQFTGMHPTLGSPPRLRSILRRGRARVSAVRGALRASEEWSLREE